MEVGKLPHNIPADMLRGVSLDDRVVVGPGVGIDAAVIDFGDRLLVSKSDPITFATDLIGWYAVNVNANDISAMGATPKWFMATILLPPGTLTAEVESIFQQIKDACEKLDVTLVGGHTEFTYELRRPIVVGCMLGEAERSSLVSPGGAKPGDNIVVTKGIALEGTSILARNAGEHLSTLRVDSETIEQAANFLFNPGISVVHDSRIATKAVPVTAMHDPTEGGLATGLMEVAHASGLGLEVDLDSIPILPETMKICRTLGLDPLGLIASGSLLLTVAPSDTATLMQSFAENGVDASVIGQMKPLEHGLKMRSGSTVIELPSFIRDEIARFFGPSVG